MRLSILLQHLLPHRALSRIVYWATRWTWRPWKDFLIGRVIAAYDVDMRQALVPDPRAYRDFNAFFTRALVADARPLPADPQALLSPADGTISAIGTCAATRMLQAKGRDFAIGELLGDDAAAQPFADGRFVTVYLSPRDYHRVHMPRTGTLRETVHVPGRLFSVAPFTVDAIPNLFARNERLVCHFDGADGPFAVVLVGAMLVSSIETVWGGLEIPPYGSAITRKSWSGREIRLERGAEMGRFAMGSTVIALFPAATVEWDPKLGPNSKVQVRSALGRAPGNAINH
jgi:phosphatidylserine decarboxylase